MKEHYSGNIMADLLDADYEKWLDEEDESRVWRDILNEEEKIERAIDRRHRG